MYPPSQLQRPSALSSKDLSFMRVRYHLPQRLLWSLNVVFIWGYLLAAYFPSTHCARNWYFHALSKHSKCDCDSNQESSLSDELWITVNRLLTEGKCYYKSVGCIVYRLLKYLQSHIYLKREHIIVFSYVHFYERSFSLFCENRKLCLKIYCN